VSGSVVVGETSLEELLQLLGPPQAIERDNDEWLFVWKQRSLDRRRRGLALGLLGFGATLSDHEESSDPLLSIVVIVRDDVVQAIGGRSPGQVSGSADRPSPAGG